MKNVLLSRVLFCTTLASLMVCNVSMAQRNRIDSLQTLLIRDKEDTIKIIHLNLLAWEYKSINPDTSISLSLNALSLNKNIKWKRGFAKLYTNLGNYKMLKGELNAALEYEFTGLSLWEELKDNKGKNRAFENIARTYFSLGDYSRALEYFIKTQKIVEKVGTQNELASCLCNIGSVYLSSKDYQRSLDYYFKALKIAEGSRYVEVQANCLGNIGAVYSEMGNNAKALDYHFRALKITEENRIISAQADNLCNIGNAYYYLNKYTESETYFLKALKIYEALGLDVGIANDLANIGKLYVATGKFSKAEAALKKAIAIENSSGALKELREAEEMLSVLYDTTGRYKLALIHFKKASILKDSLFSAERTKELTRQAMNYEFDKKESLTKAEQQKKEALALKEFQKEKLLNYFSFGGIGLILLLFFFIYRNYRVRQELRLLDIRNRIARDLHDDIGSTLNSISIYSEIAKLKNTEESQRNKFLETIGNSSRYMIEQMNDIVWAVNPVNDKFENILFRMRSYVSELTEGANVTLSMHMDEKCKSISLNMNKRKNFYLVFKEAVNNAVKYSEASEVNVSVNLNDNFLYLKVADNGLGFEVERELENVDNQGGNGLKNMKARAEEIKAVFNILSVPGKGTSVELKMKI
ncbi:MAG: tetratricopeptide repeat protein [Bacteroidetes bacterium]|nr:tetratricopeptide repeat protein [Bacteroidota bacterium]